MFSKFCEVDATLSSLLLVPDSVRLESAKGEAELEAHAPPSTGQKTRRTPATDVRGAHGTKSIIGEGGGPNSERAKMLAQEAPGQFKRTHTQGSRAPVPQLELRC